MTRQAQSRPQPPNPTCSNRIGFTVSARIRQVVKPITEIGAAVVGTGFIGVVHVEALRRLGVQVHGVVGSSRQRAASRARDLGLPPAYESFQAMLDDARGDVRLVSGHYLQDWLLLDTDWNWRLDPQLGGDLRAVADIGSHWMDLTTFLTGQRITAVMADLTTFIKTRLQPSGPVETFATGRAVDAVAREIHTEDVATILLHYEDGARGAVTVSQLSAGRKNSLVFEIDGSSSAASWNSENPDELWIGHRGRPNELLVRDA